MILTMDSILRGISRKVAIKPPVIPNKSLNSGIFHDNMGNMPSIPFLLATRKEKIRVPVINPQYETGSISTERGAFVIPDSKDFYLGEYTNNGF